MNDRPEIIIGRVPTEKWSHPLDVFGVPAALGMTPAQVRRYREGESPEDVLDAGQKATLATLGGKKANVVEMFVASRPNTAAFDAEPAIAEVAEAGLLPQLTLRPAQAATMADALNAYNADRSLTDDRRAGMKALEASANALLDETQKRRLTQLRMQVSAARDPVFTLRAWGESLSLTDAQHKAIILARAYHTAAALRIQETDRAGTRSEAAERAQRRLRDRLDSTLIGILTEKQRAAWRDLAGEAVPTLTKTLIDEWQSKACNWGGGGRGIGGGGGRGLGGGGR